MTASEYLISKSDAISKRVYHTDESCVNLPDRTKPLTQSEVDRRGLRECKHRAGTVEYPDTNKPALRYHV